MAMALSTNLSTSFGFVIIITLSIAGVFTFETVLRALATPPLQWAGGILGAWLFAQVPAEIIIKRPRKVQLSGKSPKK